MSNSNTTVFASIGSVTANGTSIIVNDKYGIAVIKEA